MNSHSPNLEREVKVNGTPVFLVEFEVIRTKDEITHGRWPSTQIMRDWTQFRNDQDCHALFIITSGKGKYAAIHKLSDRLKIAGFFDRHHLAKKEL